MTIFRKSLILALATHQGSDPGLQTKIPSDMFHNYVSAYPGSVFVVANTLAKWKKLEPNEINFNKGFSQKVVSLSCFVFNSLLASGTFGCLLITFANSLDPDQARENNGPDLDPSCLTSKWY